MATMSRTTDGAVHHPPPAPSTSADTRSSGVIEVAGPLPWRCRSSGCRMSRRSVTATTYSEPPNVFWWVAAITPSSDSPSASSDASTGRTRSAKSAAIAPPRPFHPCPRVVVHLERFLDGPDVFGHVAEVQPDAGPRGASPSHGVHHQISRSEERPYVGMPGLPPLQSFACFLLGGGPGDLD